MAARFTMSTSALDGACFVLRLPALPAGMADARVAAIRPASPPASPEPGARSSSTTSRRSPKSSQTCSARHGFACDIVTSGDAAKRRLRNEDYDLVLCDLRMPGIDGPALFAWMESEAPHLAAAPPSSPATRSATPPAPSSPAAAAPCWKNRSARPR